jgi:hypothetical protein
MGRSSSPGRPKNFLSPLPFRPVIVSTQHLRQYVPGALSPGEKRQEREAYYSLPICAKVKKTWTYTSIPPFVFKA